MMGKQRGLYTFMAVCFILPLICSLLMMFAPFCQSGWGNLVLYGIEGASPALAALVAVSFSHEGGGRTQFFTRKYKHNLSLTYCAVGFLVPALVLTLAKGIVNIIMKQATFLTLPSSRKLIIIAWALIAEELGWRGYLQEKLEKKVGVNLTPLLIGILWSLWHYHFFLTGSMGEVPLAVFVYGCIVESYGYYVLTKWSKGNIVPASLWHFSGNLFFNLYLLSPDYNEGSMLPYIIVNGIYSIYIVAFLWYKRQGKNRISAG